MKPEISSHFAPLQVGDEFLRYQVRALIGHGDHAYVYEAYDPLLDRIIALKLIPDPPNTKRDLVQRSLEQAPVLRDLRHRNLVSVYDVGTIGDELVYIVMDRLVGRTLRSVLDEQHRLTALELLPIGIEVAQGMALCHFQQVLHRDLKPENVFITENDGIKVINAGITSWVIPSDMTTERDFIRGTLLYMSPEHIQGFGVTARSDIYSLGTLLYECLAGSAPVLVGAERLTLDAVIWRQIGHMPPPLDELCPEVPAQLARVIQQMLAKEAVLRFGTMDEVAGRLRECHRQLQKESGDAGCAPLDERPYIVFPSSAIGMNSSPPDDRPSNDDVVAGAERVINERALALTDTGGHGESTPGPHGFARESRKPHNRLIIAAVALGALVGVVFAVYSSRSSRLRDANQRPTTNDQQPALGQAAASSLMQPNGPNVLRRDAKNQEITSVYEAGAAGGDPSQRPSSHAVINPGKPGPSEAHSKANSGNLVF